MAGQSLDQTFKAIYSAIVDAQNTIEQHYLGEITQDYFDDKGFPKMVTIMLPNSNGRLEQTDIPAITLVPHNGMAINKVSIKMKVALGSNGDTKQSKAVTQDKPNKIKKFFTDLSNRNGTRMAEIEVVFNGKEPPEGLARIKDSLIKIIPN